MLGLSKSTEFNRRIPKQKFYENIRVTSTLKHVFVNQIKGIYWRNKIAPSTMNLEAGREVTELEVFEIKLNSPSLDESVLKKIDKEIPYHILFLLEYEGKYQGWIGYKEAAVSGSNSFKVNRYYHTSWMRAEELPLKVEGLNIDTVYENFVRQIAGEVLKEVRDETLKESVNREEKLQQLKKQIIALQARVRKEKQLNKQMQMNAELKKMKKELEGLINE